MEGAFVQRWRGRALELLGGWGSVEELSLRSSSKSLQAELPAWLSVSGTHRMLAWQRPWEPGVRDAVFPGAMLSGFDHRGERCSQSMRVTVGQVLWSGLALQSGAFGAPGQCDQNSCVKIGF